MFKIFKGKQLLLFGLMVLLQSCSKTEQPMVEVTLEVLPTNKVEFCELLLRGIAFKNNLSGEFHDVHFENEMFRIIDLRTNEIDKKIEAFKSIVPFSYNEVSLNISMTGVSKDDNIHFVENKETAPFPFTEFQELENNTIYQVNITLDMEESLVIVENQGTNFYFSAVYDLEILSK